MKSPKRERYKLSLSVFMILRDGNRVLLIKRGNTGWMDGYYSLPAGAIDGDESLTHEIVRETKEEVNVDVDVKDAIYVHTMHNTTNGEEWVGSYFMTEKWKGEPIVNEPHKHTEVRWVDIDDIPEKTIPYVKQALKAVGNKEIYSEFGWREV